MDEQDVSASADPVDDIARLIEEQDEQDDQDEPQAAADDPDEPEGDEPEEAGEEEPEERSGRYRVAVKAEDGSIVEQQVTLDDLKAGYTRGQELAAARHQFESQIRSTQQEAAGHVQRVSQESTQKLSQLETLVSQALQVTTPAEMMSLAQSDPQEFAKAQFRMQTLQGVMQQIRAEQEQVALRQKHAQANQLQQTLDASRSELAKRGITTSQIQKIYEQTAKPYGFSPEELNGLVSDYRWVLVLKDAAEHRRLAEKKPHVAQKLREAPKLPPSKLQSARRSDVQREKRFASGRATLDDLAASFME